MTAPPTPQPKPTTKTAPPTEAPPPTETAPPIETPPPTLYAAALSALFTTYRRLLSPVFAASGLGHCRYLPSCSEYAHIALARHGPLRGTALAVARLARCHPWATGGLDPVPPTAAPPAAATTQPAAPGHPPTAAVHESSQ